MSGRTDNIRQAIEMAMARIGCPPGDNADADLYRELQSALSSQVIGEQTPVAWRHKVEGGWVVTKTMHAGSEPLYRFPISPEARDRAINALEITSRALANYESGVPIKVDDLRKWNSQALSALRGE